MIRQVISDSFRQAFNYENRNWMFRWLGRLMFGMLGFQRFSSMPSASSGGNVENIVRITDAGGKVTTVRNSSTQVISATPGTTVEVRRGYSRGTGHAMLWIFHLLGCVFLAIIIFSGGYQDGGRNWVLGQWVLGFMLSIYLFDLVWILVVRYRMNKARGKDYVFGGISMVFFILVSLFFIVLVMIWASGTSLGLLWPVRIFHPVFLT